MSNVADEEDIRFFFQHPDRKAHIRNPRQMIEIDGQRAASYAGELEREFRSLGSHNRTRRRIILWRIPVDNSFYDPKKPGVLKIPFLAFADETIEDNDSVLLPILDEMMRDPRNIR